MLQAPSQSEALNTLRAGDDFGREHLVVLAREMLVMRETGSLPDNSRLRELSAYFQGQGFPSHLALAEATVTRLCMEQVSGHRMKRPYDEQPGAAPAA